MAARPLRLSIASALTFLALPAPSQQAVDPARAEVQWSPRELAYLQSRGPIRMCVAPDWMPIEGIDRDGRHVGMAADFIALMARQGGLNLELVPARTWEESYALGLQRQCDIFSLLMDAPSRRAFLDFTTPYLEIPGVIATSTNVPFVADLDQVRSERLGHMRGFAGLELLRDRWSSSASAGPPSMPSRGWRSSAARSSARSWLSTGSRRA